MRLIDKGSRSSRARARMRSHVVPNLEQFENRLLLAAFTVNDAADTNTAGTLRFVLGQLAASPDPTNEVDFMVGGGGTLTTITLTADLPTITKPVTILGDTQGGTPNSAVDGTNATVL